MGSAPAAAVALCASLLVACAPGPRNAPTAPATGALARVRAAGVLRWGGDLAGGEPYVYEDREHPGHLLGFEVELADAIARELGVRAEFAQNDWSQLLPALERGGFDVILNGLEVTPRTAARVALTRPYYIFTERLTARRDDGRLVGKAGPSSSPASSLASLAGLRVGTLSSSYASDLLAGTRAEVVLYEGTDTPYDDLATGRTDAVLLDDIIAERYGAVHKTLVTVGDVASGYYAAGVRREDGELRDAIDAALARITRSGELRGILERARLWREREAELLEWTDERTRSLVSSTGGGARFGRGDVRLFLVGALYTLLVSSAAMVLAIALGVALALARGFGPRSLRTVATAYVEVLRGTPVLLQLYVLYYGLADVVRLGPLSAAVLGLGLNYAAYEAEVYRAGLQAVPRGQLDAALSLGMSLGQALRRVLLPQAVRLALPNVTNDFIALLKDSSLVSVITVVELTKQTQIAAIETRSWLLPGLLCAGLYFAMSYPLSRWARRLERRLAGA